MFQLALFQLRWPSSEETRKPVFRIKWKVSIIITWDDNLKDFWFKRNGRSLFSEVTHSVDGNTSGLLYKTIIDEFIFHLIYFFFFSPQGSWNILLISNRVTHRGGLSRRRKTSLLIILGKCSPFPFRTQNSSSLRSDP